MLFAFIGLYRGGLAVFAADAAGSAANGTAPAAIVSVAAVGNGRVSAVQRIGGIFCRGAAGRLCSSVFARYVVGWSILQQMTTHAVRVLLWLMPYGIGASFLLLLAARETLWLSNLFFCYAFHRQWEENMPHCRRLYLVRYAVILGLFSGLSLLCLGLQKLQALWI